MWRKPIGAEGGDERSARSARSARSWADDHSLRIDDDGAVNDEKFDEMNEEWRRNRVIVLVRLRLRVCVCCATTAM